MRLHSLCEERERTRREHDNTETKQAASGGSSSSSSSSSSSDEAESHHRGVRPGSGFDWSHCGALGGARWSQGEKGEAGRGRREIEAADLTAVGVRLNGVSPTAARLGRHCAPYRSLAFSAQRNVQSRTATRSS